MTSKIEAAGLEQDFVMTPMITSIATRVAVYNETVIDTTHACCTWLPCNQGQAGRDGTGILLLTRLSGQYVDAMLGRW